MKKLLTILAALSLTFALAGCKTDPEPTPDPDPLTCEEGQELNEAGDACVDIVVVVNEAPVITGAADVTLEIGEAFDPAAGIAASDDEDGDLTASITVVGSVDNTTPGEYQLTYTVEDSEGEEFSVTITVTVSNYEFTYPNGFYNYKFADTELRHDLMAAAEKYIMNNMFGGVPLFASGSFNLYSSRLQLPVDEYVAVMGFGTVFGTMSADDSTVLMDDGNPGNAGEYTYRTTINPGPVTYNQWLYDTSTDSDLMGLYYDSLYKYVFNADKTGYEVVGSMAAGDPYPVDPHLTETGKEVSTTWRVPVAADLEWYFHPDTEQAFLDTNPDMSIDATDFIDTFELALAENWFRAVSGGGDFCSSSTDEIEGACDFSDGTDPDFNNVGLKAVMDDNGDYTILEFTFVNDHSNWNTRYFLSSFVMTPINLEMYNYFEAGLGEGDANPYGSSNTEIGYTGAYYIDYYEADKVVRFLKNPSYHTPDEFFYTGYNYSIIADATTIFNEFVAGKLEATGLPTAEVDNYINHPGLKKVPGPTQYRMMINGLGTVEAQRAQFPNGTWEPEILLSNVDFKMAMFHAVDRKTLAEDILKVRTNNMFYFTNAYLVDAELGTPYRSTPQGISVGEGLFADTFGYNFDYAKALYLQAVADLIASGDITPGTSDNYEVITLELNNYSNSESWDLACGYLKTTFEDTFVDDVNFVKVQIDIYTKDFPAIYYDYMMTGEFDMSVGGISGSTLDAASFLDTYSTDDRSGFTINWGIDSSVAEIPVVYTTFDGVIHAEIWSFDALATALNGEIFVQDGMEAEVPAPKDVNPTLFGVEFSVTEFNNAAYENLTYTIQWYDASVDEYFDLDGYVGLTVPASGDVVVVGLDPGYDDYPTMYIGDYQIVVEFKYAGTEKEGSTSSSWWMSPSTVAEVTDASTATTLDVTLVQHADYSAAVTSVVLLDAAYADTSVAVTVNGLQLTASGLTAETTYVLQITYADGIVDYVMVTLPAAV